MSEQNEEIVKMEQAEYIEYLQNQMKETPDADKTPVAQLTMFDMNKDLIKGLKKMNNMAINNALENVKEWFGKQDPKCLHYALLNHEKHYFTIFASANDFCSVDSFIKELKDILMNYYGDNDIRSIDVDTNGAIEIWGMWDGEPTVAYLFPYEQGVVYY